MLGEGAGGGAARWNCLCRGDQGEAGSVPAAGARYSTSQVDALALPTTRPTTPSLMPIPQITCNQPKTPTNIPTPTKDPTKIPPAPYSWLCPTQPTNTLSAARAISRHTPAVNPTVCPLALPQPTGNPTNSPPPPGLPTKIPPALSLWRLLTPPIDHLCTT